MSEWITVAAGLGGATIGAAGGMWGASRGARAVKDTRLQQEIHEQRSWVRDQRREAYQALLTADLQLTAVAPVAWQARDGAAHLSREVADQVVQARREVYAGVTGIEITGPDDVAKAAGRLLETGTQLLGVWGFERAASAEDRGAALRQHEHARAEFRRAARAALGFDR
ncbi:hypothetical protein [Streptomyces phaeoluteigriseus]|uniref:hypothetical protein n=1 Tax=Streptomyces phaeoluteigriseus TaxID=114686 RepID=UPI0036C70BCB